MPSYVIHRGTSEIDRTSRIVVIATVSNANRKTGDMLQTYILLEDVPPMEGVKTGADSAICGGCVHRGNGKDGTGRTCYVNLAHGPRVVYASYRAGGLPDISHDPAAINALGNGRVVRLGTYGDPVAVPLNVWRNLLAGSIGRSGYTHQWRAAKFAAFRPILQASCDTPGDFERARASGWGTFTTVPVGGTLPGALLCPASAEAGTSQGLGLPQGLLKRVQCVDCLMCDGASQRHVYIPAHGASRKRYTGKRQALQVLA